MSIFQKLFKNKNAVKKDKAIVFVDYEHWYYSIQKNFGLKPEPVSWRRKLEEQYDLEDVMVFADFGHKGIDGELTKLRNMTNTIIETQQTFSRYKKDMTDFIMLDYIYQTAYTKPDITTFIIFTGDGHFQSVTKYLIQKLNKKVIIYGVRDSVSKQLRTVASECYMLPTDAETLRGSDGVTTAGASITFDDVMDLFYSLRSPYRKKAVWMLNDSTVKALRKLKDGNGNYIWQPSVQAGVPDMILNRPYFTSSFVPEIAAGQKIMAFGDFSYYWIADRQGRSFKRLNELFAATGQVGFLASQRVDGKLILPEAVKTMKLKETR